MPLPRWLFAWLLVALVAGTLGCAEVRGLQTEKAPPEPPPADDAEIYRRAEGERADALQRENERLRADLQAAEEAIVAVESGLRGRQTRADAVSKLAEARIELEKASSKAPWRKQAVREARDKLEESERQIQVGHFGSAIFFASRARRIAVTLLEEANDVEGALFVTGRRVNFRSGPSTDEPVLQVLVRSTPVFPERSEGEWLLVRTTHGAVGWVHHTLVRRAIP